MASLLKRKRGAAQKEDEALKRAKATETAERPQDGSWDKLFAPLNKTLNQEIVVLNGDNEKEEESSQKDGKKKKEKKSKSSSAGRGWRVSKPFGGRMIDVDPVFTEDEK